jgi:hypothetical protein
MLADDDEAVAIRSLEVANKMKGFGELLVPLGALAWLGGMLLGAYELAYWLKKGTWLHLTLASPFGPFISNETACSAKFCKSAISESANSRTS